MLYLIIDAGQKEQFKVTDRKPDDDSGECFVTVQCPHTLEMLDEFMATGQCKLASDVMALYRAVKNLAEHNDIGDLPRDNPLVQAETNMIKELLSKVFE